MRQLKPRKRKPLYFDLCVRGRDVTVLNVREVPIDRWHETIDTLDHKGILPKQSAKRRMLEMLEKRL